LTDISLSQFEVLPDVWVQNELLEQTRDYLGRGRRFHRLEIDDLNEKWAAAFRQFVTKQNGPHARDMDDAGAELRLRGAEFPTHLVVPEVEQLRYAIQRLDVTTPTIEFKQRLAEFISEMNRPKN
jgi:hypothetical protein